MSRRRTTVASLALLACSVAAACEDERPPPVVPPEGVPDATVGAMPHGRLKLVCFAGASPILLLMVTDAVTDCAVEPTGESFSFNIFAGPGLEAPQHYVIPSDSVRGSYCTGTDCSSIFSGTLDIRAYRRGVGAMGSFSVEIAAGQREDSFSAISCDDGITCEF